MAKATGPDNPHCVLHGEMLSGVAKKVDRILVCIEGDNDHVGLKMEVDRLTRTVKFYTRCSWLVAGVVVTLIVTRVSILLASGTITTP